VAELIVPPFAGALLLLADCLCERLADTPGGSPCWCGILPGASPAWDYCGGECNDGACGMGYVRLDLTNPSESFPTATLDYNCTKPLAHRVEIGVLRCMPILDDGEVPDPTVLAEVALVQWHDMWAAYRALTCCGAFTDVVVEQYLPLGPEGGCVGGAWYGWIGVD
jgi:hypothetical protein